MDGRGKDLVEAETVIEDIERHVHRGNPMMEEVRIGKRVLQLKTLRISASPP